jgi:hypothetical protein
MESDLVMQTARSYQECDQTFSGNLQATIKYLQLPESSIAACDRLFRNFFHGEKVDRYSTVFVRFELDANGNLFLAAGPNESGAGVNGGAPTYEWFANGLRPGSKGQTDHLYSAPPAVPGTSVLPGEGSPWVLSKSDTDGLDSVDTREGGAELTSNQLVDFFVSAVGVEWVGIFEAVPNPMGGSASDGTIARQRSAWAIRDQGAYTRRIQEYLARHATIRIAREGEKFSKNGLDYNLGACADWTAYSEFFGGGNVAGGQPMMYALKLLPLPILAGRAPKLVTSNRFRFLLDVDSVGVIDSDPVNPIPGSLSPAISQSSPFRNSIFVGLRLKLTGGMICVDQNGVPTGLEFESLKDAIAKLPADQKAQIKDAINGR